MDKKISVILVCIFAFCGIIITAGSVSADISSINITSPTATNKAYVKSGSAVTVDFTISGVSEDEGTFTVIIGQTESPIGTTTSNFTIGESGTLDVTTNVQINEEATENSYNVTVSAVKTGQESAITSTETGAVVVDNTAPESEANIRKYIYGPNTWDNDKTIKGTVSDGAGSGVKTITITIKDDTSKKYWDGDSWETVATDLIPTLTGENWTYSLNKNNLTDGHEYIVTPKATDNADNSTIGDDDSFTYDATAPVVTGISVSQSTVSQSHLTQRLYIYYDEWVDTSVGPSVTFSIGTWMPGGGAWGYYQPYYNGSWIMYWDQTFTLADQDEEITGVTISVSGAKDEAGNEQTPYTSSALFNIDTKAPAAPTVSGLPADRPILIDADKLNIEVTAEANSLIKFYRGGTYISGYQLSDGATNYTFDLPLIQDSVNEFTVTATDAVGNESEATALPDITEDSTAPSVVISSTASNPTNTSPIPMTATFSEPVDGFTIGDIVVTNGTADALAGGLITFTFNVTPTAEGVVTVSIPAGVAKDYLGKDNTASNQFTIIYNRIEPVVTLNNTFTVGNGMDFNSIQEAINTAISGDTIRIANGVYQENLSITKKLTLEGMGTEVILDASKGDYGIQINNTNENDDIIIKNLTIKKALKNGVYITPTNKSRVTLIKNNIIDNNNFGVYNDSTVIVDATKNWWGDVSGPSGSGKGIGDAVSNSVNYDPWLDRDGKEINFKGLIVSQNTRTGEDIIDAKSKFNVEIIKTGNGTPTINVSQYSHNPGNDFIGDLGKYIYARISDNTDITQLEIKFYYTDSEIIGKDESTLKIYWWNGKNWVLCSDTGVNTSLNYIWAKIRSDTNPSLTQLRGFTFGFKGNNSTSENERKRKTPPQFVSTTSTVPITSDNSDTSTNSAGKTSNSDKMSNSSKTPTINDLMVRVNDLKTQLQELQNKLSQSTNKIILSKKLYEGIPQEYKFNFDLKEGDFSDDVKYLQIILKNEIGEPTYPESVPVTGWFGPITKSSVIKFQEKYALDILAPFNLINGTGFVGSATRAKLNQLLGK